MHITLDLDQLAAHACEVIGRQGDLDQVHLTRLAGGYSAAVGYRVDLTIALEGNERQVVSVAQKQASARQVRTMQALGTVAEAPSLPYLIAAERTPGVVTGGGSAEQWFVTPFYDGTHLGWEDEVPEEVIASLARVHAHFESRLDRINWLPRLNASHLRWMLDQARHAIQAALGRQPAPQFVEAEAQLSAQEALDAVWAAQEKLPLTLAHGDVHPGNIIRLSGGGAVLIDWGNARLAPAMFDLANLVEIDSENWDLYLSTYDAAGGSAAGTALAPLGYHWATVAINLQYLPFPAEHWPEDAGAPAQVLGMVERLLHAARVVEELS